LAHSSKTVIIIIVARRHLSCYPKHRRDQCPSSVLANRNYGDRFRRLRWVLSLPLAAPSERGLPCSLRKALVCGRVSNSESVPTPRTAYLAFSFVSSFSSHVCPPLACPSQGPPIRSQYPRTSPRAPLPLCSHSIRPPLAGARQAPSLIPLRLGDFLHYAATRPFLWSIASRARSGGPILGPTTPPCECATRLFVL